MTEELFREAYQAAPDYPVSFPQLAMVFVARNRWTELSAFATHHLRTASFDPSAWLALGLASQRLGDAPKAATTIRPARARHFILSPCPPRASTNGASDSSLARA